MFHALIADLSCREIFKKPRRMFLSDRLREDANRFLGLELQLLTEYKGKLVWALNREHLTYLINYISADLREKPLYNNTMRTQADMLPAFLKTAKNRKGIIKCLEKMYKLS